MIPKHVSIIMDGNGRWAQKRGMERLFGHTMGRESFRRAIIAAAKAGIEILSLFAFSSENWNRPKCEVDGLMDLLVRAVSEETHNLIKENVRIRYIGELSKMPTYVRECVERSVEETSSCSGLTVILALSYSGTWDILQAVNRCIDDYKNGKINSIQIDAAFFEQYLSTAGFPHPDLLIRTSGEERISNFMLWQLAYTELYFTETLWPDFGEEDLLKALHEYTHRNRRFGKTGEQCNE